MPKVDSKWGYDEGEHRAREGANRPIRIVKSPGNWLTWLDESSRHFPSVPHYSAVSARLQVRLQLSGGLLLTVLDARVVNQRPH